MHALSGEQLGRDSDQDESCLAFSLLTTAQGSKGQAYKFTFDITGRSLEGGETLLYSGLGLANSGGRVENCLRRSSPVAGVVVRSGYTTCWAVGIDGWLVDIATAGDLGKDRTNLTFSVHSNS